MFGSASPEERCASRRRSLALPAPSLTSSGSLTCFFFWLRSSGRSQHSLEADGILPGGLLDCQEGGGDLRQHRRQAQREKRGRASRKETISDLNCSPWIKQ